MSDEYEYSTPDNGADRKQVSNLNIPNNCSLSRGNNALVLHSFRGPTVRIEMARRLMTSSICPIVKSDNFWWPHIAILSQ